MAFLLQGFVESRSGLSERHSLIFVTIFFLLSIGYSLNYLAIQGFKTMRKVTEGPHPDHRILRMIEELFRYLHQVS